MNLRETITNLTGLKYKYNENTFKGGYVMEPTGAFYRDVIVVDFKRFYPFIIVSNNLFGTNMSLYLKTLLDSSINDEGEKKIQSKLLLNSIYGVMKHFDFDKAQKCAELGRDYINLAKDIFTREGFNVVSADTDSLTVQGEYREVNQVCTKIIHFIKCNQENPQELFNLEIENIFKYIYYFSNGSGFKKKQYLGVRYNGNIILKSRKLNRDEELVWGFIAPLLRQGVMSIDVNKIIPYCENVYKNTGKFINIENISIIHIKKREIKYDDR